MSAYEINQVVVKIVLVKEFSFRFVETADISNEL
jgi:hypothetical protein